MLVDTHCHLNGEEFAGDLDAVVAAAHAAGVDAVVVAGTDVADSQRAVELADRYPGLYAAVGVHPHTARDYDARALESLLALAAHPRVVAIGETGLDYHYDFSPREAQRRAFVEQVEAAAKSALPVVIHCRDAYAETLDILEQRLGRESGGVMHCWAGDAEQARRALGLGLYLGFGGMLTFRSAGWLRDLAAQVPLDRVLLETDAPYLAPVPHRGRRNQPAYVREVAAAFAQARGLTADDVALRTSANACRLFRRLGGQQSASAPKSGRSEAAT